MPSEEDQSLATLLNVEQRGELTVLISSATGQMRSDLEKAFEISEPVNKPVPSEQQEISEIELKGSEDATDVHLSPADRESEKRRRERREIALSEPKIRELKSAALDYFDIWRDNVIVRVGEVLNARDHAHESKDKTHAQKVAQESSNKDEIYQKQQHQKIVDKALTDIYPPQTTALASLSHGERATILNTILLLLLSLESYKAHSRTLLLRLASSLQVTSAEVTMMEKDIAYGLLTAASHMDGSSSASAAQHAHATSRKWKVGLASVAGAALIGVTGGLAAPLVAAGVGGLMGGLGLGATAAAGYLGALASSGVLVGGLFGAYGGKMTGKMMDAYAKEVQDFAFVPVKDEAHDEQKAKQGRRLRVTVGISGWLTREDETVNPWRVLGDGGEPFALRFELQALLALGNALQNFVNSYAWGYIKKEIIKRTILAGLWSALMLPLGMLKISKIVDNPFSVAKARADKAGEILADALINKAQGERPVSLIGYSLGSRVIYSCLLSLAQRKAFGLVDSVILMGTPMPSDAEEWRTLRAVVSGRLVNIFSENDYILAFLYRTSSVQLGIAGTQAVTGVHGVENLNVSDTVSGHLRYQYMIGDILTRAGWPDIDEHELQRELQLRQKVAAEEMKEKEQEAPLVDGEPDDEKLEAEAKRLEAKVAINSTQEQGRQSQFPSGTVSHRQYA